MSIEKRIASVTEDLQAWFNSAKKTFPQVTYGAQSQLWPILSKLDPVVARLEADGQPKLCSKLRDTVKRHDVFCYKIGGTEDVSAYLTNQHKRLVEVLQECSDYFESPDSQLRMQEEPPPARKDDPLVKDDDSLSQDTKACAIRLEHNTWTHSQIAKAVG